jgi:hypothetical protein
MKNKITTLTISGIFLLGILLISNPISAQSRTKGHIGFRASATLSANRFGIIYTPGLLFRHNRSLLAFDAAIQRNNSNISGIQLNYEYTLVDPYEQRDCYLDWLELYFFINAGYHNNAMLGKALSEEEYASNPELQTDLSTLRLKAADAYAGFGVRILINRNLKWFNSIGIGGYEVLNMPKGLYYNDKALGLMIRTGISYQFKRKYKTNF